MKHLLNIALLCTLAPIMVNASFTAGTVAGELARTRARYNKDCQNLKEAVAKANKNDCQTPAWEQASDSRWCSIYAKNMNETFDQLQKLEATQAALEQRD